jgi:hypothetical protein
MNSHRRLDSISTHPIEVPHRASRWRACAWLCVLATAATLLTGCAHIKQYSIDSWQGPLPIRDLHYVQVEQ